MIEIKCSKAQFDRIMKNLTEGGILVNNKCVLGKSAGTCPSVNGTEPELSCKDCLKRNIKRI